MTEQHSLSDTRRNLSTLVQAAENGQRVELTRRGEPVAVLIGHREFEHLTSGPGGGSARRGMSCDEFMKKLLATPVGRIVAANMLAGLRLGLYDLNALCPLLTAWKAVVTREGYTSEEVPAALVKLKEPSLAPGVPNMHVFCRRPLSTTDHGAMASVRQFHLLESCFDEDDIDQLKIYGIDSKARPGTASYSGLLKKLKKFEKSGEDERHNLRLRCGKFLTNPRLGDRAILWYTKATSLESVLNGCSSPKDWADAVRDKLGLIHCDAGEQIVAVELPPAMTDSRNDCGRPTFVEAGLHPRFRCDDGSVSSPPWGTTVDLGAPLGPTSAGVAGLPERVCGRVPSHAPNEEGQTRLSVWILGAPKISRRAPHGAGDVYFARLLEDREVRQAGNRRLEDQLFGLCHNCHQQRPMNDYGNL